MAGCCTPTQPRSIPDAVRADDSAPRPRVERTRRPERPPVNCASCGASFVPWTAGGRYCSRSCVGKASSDSATSSAKRAPNNSPPDDPLLEPTMDDGYVWRLLSALPAPPAPEPPAEPLVLLAPSVEPTPSPGVIAMCTQCGGVIPRGWGRFCSETWSRKAYRLPARLRAVATTSAVERVPLLRPISAA
jgi:hypothetical protein